MKTASNSAKTNPVITQVNNNTTLWIGHLQNDPKDHFAGQTFRCPSDGQLDNIQVYPSIVQNPGEMILTLHVFDEQKKTWGTSIGTATVHLEKNDTGKWIRFSLHPVALHKNQTYGFRLESKNAFVGIGEAVTVTKNPFTTGQEWHGDSKNAKGEFFSYFNLAYKVEMCA
jgi:hypothetical protein